jgi:cell wall-associated NlpC family hydrolase
MTLAAKIVNEARTWRGTPFRHQGRLKHQAIDCVGFISEVAKNAGVLGVEIPSNYRPHEDGSVMLQLLDEHLELVDEMQPGDVIALCDEAIRDPEIPRHLAIVTEVKPHTTFIIHASQHGVREHRMDSAWTKRIHSIWRIKHDSARQD